MFHRPSTRYEGLVYEIRNSFPFDFYAVIKCYLLHRIFRVKFREVVIQLKEIISGF